MMRVWGWARFAALALALLAVSPDASEAQRRGRGGGDEPGSFDYYALSLSWSPTYCADKGHRDGGPQCNGPRPYAFVLHGLWPQYSNGWPQFCETGQRPEGYYDVARKLYESIKIPARYQLPEEPIHTSPGDVVNDFLRANPELKPEMIVVSCDRRLKELRVCFGRDLKPRACGSNENQRKLCSRDDMLMPPARAGRN
jgi:ribonuclease T2